MSEIDLEAIKARESAATPGPWSWRGYSNEGPCLFGERTRVVLSVIRQEREADDPETKSYEDYVRDWETPYIDADGETKYRPLTEDEIAEHVKKDWLQDPWGGPQYDNRLAFRSHDTNIMQYARDIAVSEHPDAEFIRHAREDVPQLLAELARVTGERDDALITIRALVGHPELVAEGPVPLPKSQPVFCVPCMDLLPQGKLLAHRETDEHKAKVDAYREYKTAQAAAEGLSSTDDEQVPDGCVCGIVGTHPPCVWCETNATGAVNQP